MVSSLSLFSGHAYLWEGSGVSDREMIKPHPLRKSPVPLRRSPSQVYW
jgi:hypothetical protein